MDDDRRRTTDAGPWVYYKLTYEPSAQVRLKKEYPCKPQFLLYKSGG